MNYQRGMSALIGGCGAVILLTMGLPADAQERRPREIQESPHSVTVPDRPHEIPVPPPATSGRRPDGAASAGGLVVRGRFSSIQVNLNAVGNNQLGDAANEPSIAMDPTDPNRMAIGWRHFETIDSNFRQAGVAHSTDGGLSWTSPFGSVLDPLQFRSDPVLASDRGGAFYYSSLSTLTSIEMFTSFDNGASWPRLTDAFGGDKQWLTVDRTSGLGSGHIYQIWNPQFSCCAGTDFIRSIDGGASFEPPVQMPSVVGERLARPKWGTVDVGPDGTVYVVGATLEQTGHVFVRSLDAKIPDAEPTFEPSRFIDLGGVTSFGCQPNPAGLIGQVWVATDHSQSPTRGNVYVLASVDPPSGERHDIHFLRSTDGGETWSDPVRINDDAFGLGAYQWFGTMSVAPNGRIDAVWNDTREDPDVFAPTFSEVYYAYSIDGGDTWSVNEPVTPPFAHGLGYPKQDKIGDYYHMVSDNAGGNLAYAATFNGGQDVYFVRVTPDCNGNGFPDELDVSDGSSADCNGNLMPDECEPDADCNLNLIRDICEVTADVTIDCNLNGSPDSCDIADGSSLDSDGNGVPDSCECDVAPAVPDASPVSKSRYVSFSPGNDNRNVALRLTLVESAIFPELIGSAWWVGLPTVHTDSLVNGTSFTAAELGCKPEFHDWTTVDTVYVFGESVLPQSRYEVRVIRESCPLLDPTSYSSPIDAFTTLLGDVVAPFDAAGANQPDFRDISAIVRKFINDPDAVPAVFADVALPIPDQVVDFRDVGAVVDAFLGNGYGHPPPVTCGVSATKSEEGPLNGDR